MLAVCKRLIELELPLIYLMTLTDQQTQSFGYLITDKPNYAYYIEKCIYPHYI